MNVGLICSRSEAFGRVTEEYKFSSKLLIGAIETGTSELIIYDAIGYLYPCSEFRKLAEYMQKLIIDRNGDK